jgi:copper chaperone CopZ
MRSGSYLTLLLEIPMKHSPSKLATVIALGLALGCSESAPVEDADLTNAEAAALVAAETEKTTADSSDAKADAAPIETTPVAFNVEGAPTVDFSVPDMMCEQSCVPTVRETLAAQKGVKDVKVDLATKTATVAVDDAKFDPQAAVAALVDLQFTETKLVTAESKKAGDPATPETSDEPANSDDADAAKTDQPNS